MASKHKGTLERLIQKEREQGSDHGEDHTAEESEGILSASNIGIIIDEIDEKLPDYTWDNLRGKFLEVKKLKDELRRCKDAHESIVLLKEQTGDEVVANKEIYFQIVKNCFHTEIMRALFVRQIASLKDFTEKRELISSRKR